MGNMGVYLGTFQGTNYQELLLYLSQNERDVVDTFRSSIRRKEWAASRILAKYASLNTMLGKEKWGWSFVNWEQVRGELDSHHAKNIEVITPSFGSGPPLPVNKSDSISISHKWPNIAIAYSSEEMITGVDIENIKEYSSDFVEYFFKRDKTNVNVSLLYSLGERGSYITLLWSVKESYIKAKKLLNADMRKICVSIRDYKVMLDLLVPGSQTRVLSAVVEISFEMGESVWYAEIINGSDYIGVILIPYINACQKKLAISRRYKGSVVTS